MSSDWPIVQLSEIVNFKTGRLDSNAAEEGGAFPFFTCSPTTLAINTPAFDTEAVLLAGNNANGVFAVKYYKGEFNAYQRTYVITPIDKTKVSVRWLYFRIKHVTAELQKMSVGTATKFLTKKILDAFEVALPPFEIQEEIADILWALQDKIELNRQTNQTLEHIAQAIFKSWFVDFEPTRAKIAAKQAGQDPERAAMAAISGKPVEALGAIQQTNPEQYKQLKTTAALFPDALVDSELGEIPQGWEVKDLKQLSSKISKGTTPRKADMQKAEDEETIPFLKVRDISDDGEITRVGLDKIPESIHSGVLKRSMLEVNDILFSIAGTIGRVAIVEEDLVSSNCNQAVAFVRLKEPDKYLDLCRLNLVGNRVQDEVVSKVVQGVQANFSLTGLGEIKICTPEEVLLTDFNKTVGDISTKQQLLLSENRNLAELRDALLPKLLSGEIEVGNAA